MTELVKKVTYILIAGYKMATYESSIFVTAKPKESVEGFNGHFNAQASSAIFRAVVEAENLPQAGSANHNSKVTGALYNGIVNPAVEAERTYTFA